MLNPHTPDFVSNTLNRWRSTESNNTEAVREVLARTYERLGFSVPDVIWCDSPWQLTVAPLLTRLLCFTPSEFQCLKLGEDFDCNSLRCSIGRAMEANLSGPLWRRALESVMSQLHPKLELTQTGSIVERTEPDSAPMVSILEPAADRLFPDLWNMNVHDRNKIQATWHSSEVSGKSIALERLRRYRASLLSPHSKYLTERIGAGASHNMHRTPKSYEVETGGHLRSAFEQNLCSDTGVSINEMQDSEAPSLETRDVLAQQFEQQMGDLFCQQISVLLASREESGISKRAYKIMEALYKQSTTRVRCWPAKRSEGVLLPKMFFDNNLAGLKSLLQVQIVADAFERYLIWGRWSLDYLRISMQLADPDLRETSEAKDHLLDFQLMLDGAFMYVFEDNFVYACKSPISLHIDESGKLHSYTAPAIEFADGYRMYFWQNVRIKEELVTKPEVLTAEFIVNERNAEIQRVLIDRYGPTRFLEESGATKVAEDSAGALYHVLDHDNDVIALVKVFNRTAEADAATKEYVLRVPPNTRTAREGIAACR